jgi:Zn-dependent M28 family amino/carboxypeptidase
VNLGAKLKAHMVSKVRNFESNNVLAMLPGSNSKLKDEAVLYTAHYDHLGIRPEMPGDNIYNGANDNATGCGILLEVARAYSLSTQRPGGQYFCRSDGGRAGTAGSEYLGKHPPSARGEDCARFEL